MKRNPLIRFIPFRLALLVAPLVAAWPQQSRAANQEWAGASNGTWHTLTNWTGGAGFPGDSTLNAAGEGASGDIMSIAAANATGTIGLNMSTLGGLSLGAIDINKTNTTGVTLANNSGSSGTLRLNGATVNSVAGTFIRNTASANLALNRFNSGANPGLLNLELGSTSGFITVDTGRTLTVNPVISEAAPLSGFTKNGAGSLILTTANPITGTVSVEDGLIRIQTNTGVGAGPVQIRNMVVNASADNNDLQISGGITGGNNVLMENGNNQNSRVRLQSTNAINNAGNTWNGNITFKSSFSTPAGLQTVIADTANLTVNGSFLQDALLPSPQIFIRGGNVYASGTMNGNILLGSNATLFKTDPGMWTITSTGNTMGPVVCAAGTLALNNNDVLEPDTVLTMGQNSATTGFVQIGTGFVQQLTGINSAVSSTSPTGHFISGPGSIDFGATPRVINTPDNTATQNELTINAAITGSGGFTKGDTGNLIMNGTVSGPVIVNTGGLGGRGNLSAGVTVNPTAVLGAGTVTTSATLAAAGVTLAAGSNIAATIGTTAAGGSDFIDNSGALTSAGTTLFLTGTGSLTNGDIPLIGYTGASPTTAPFTLAAPPLGSIGSRATAALVDTGSAIGVTISGADTCYWAGTASAAWDVAGTANWKLQSNDSDTNFQQLDSILFDDRGDDVDPSRTTVVLNPTANPVRVQFANTTAVPYTLTGSGGLGNGALPSLMSLDKTGDGTATLALANTYTGPTNVTNGVLIANAAPGAAAAAINAIPPASTVNVTGSGVVRFGGDNTTATAVAVNVPHTITGNGTVEHNARMTAGQTAALSSTFTGNNSGFTGTLRLLTPASGTQRLNGVPSPALGTASVDVQSGHQVLTANGHVYSNALTLAGTGYADANGFLGALRLEANSVWAGNITVAAGGARIDCHNVSLAQGGVVSGNISGGPLEVNVTNYPNNYVVHFTGTNSYTTTTVGGVGAGFTPQNTANVNLRLNIGTGGTTGTLGSGAVTIYGDSAAGATANFSNGVLGFDRSDGYTLAAGNTIGVAGSNVNRTFMDLDCLGTGFDNAGVAIDLGTAGGAGGQIRVGATRAGAIAKLSGTVEAASFIVGLHNTGTPTTNALTTLKSGANVSVTSVSVSTGGSTSPVGNTSGGTLTVEAGATLNCTSNLYAGDGAFSSGNLNIAGNVTVAQQVRIGHWPSAVSTANMTAGSLLLTGDSPTLTPSTTGAGAANATGDNNINALATPAIVGGGIYLGNDGVGILNHSGGTITTNWIVLDNRANSGAAAGTGDGIDRYNLSGAGELRLRSEWGLIARNVSTDVSLGGGSIVLDNTGTGGPAGNTGADLDVPLDAALSTVAATTTTLDTNGALNSFTLPKAISGSGDLRLIGGGDTIVSGTSPAYAGTVKVENGTLRLNGSLAGSQLVKTGSTLAGTGTGGAITVENGGILSPGASVGTLSGATADLQAGSRYDVEITAAATSDKLALTGALTANGTIKVILSGYVPVQGNTFDIADASGISGSPAFDFTAAALTAGLIWDTSAFATTGVISVIADDPYDAWATANGVTGGKGGDHDLDGVSNLLEFATNSNAASDGSGARAYPSLASLGGDSVLTLTVATRSGAVFAADGAAQKATKDKIVYTVEGTSDLTTWDSVVTELNAVDSAAVQATLTLPALDAGWEWHTFRTDDGVTGDPRDYIRLKVAVAP